ncbi:MAG TPA: DUF4266 domain-containing protein [Opitutaceae bacterium]|nr:DUF4266 domain-containing protein [Opitutaceae bacterium]
MMRLTLKHVRVTSIILGAAVGVEVLTGCTTVRVQPWERGALAQYAMRGDRDPLATSLADHVFFSREAATGGRGVGGSGCGCN